MRQCERSGVLSLLQPQSREQQAESNTACPDYMWLNKDDPDPRVQTTQVIPTASVVVDGGGAFAGGTSGNHRSGQLLSHRDRIRG